MSTDCPEEDARLAEAAELYNRLVNIARDYSSKEAIAATVQVLVTLLCESVRSPADANKIMLALYRRIVRDIPERFACAPARNATEAPPAALRAKP